MSPYCFSPPSSEFIFPPSSLIRAFLHFSHFPHRLLVPCGSLPPPQQWLHFIFLVSPVIPGYVLMSENLPLGTLGTSVKLFSRRLLWRKQLRQHPSVWCFGWFCMQKLWRVKTDTCSSTAPAVADYFLRASGRHYIVSDH